MQILHSSSKRLKRMEYVSSHCGASITLILKPKTAQKRKLQTKISHEHRCKNPQWNINKPNSVIVQKDQCDWVGFIPGMQSWFNIHKSISVIHINKMKDKICMIISIDAKKAFDKMQHPFIIFLKISKVGIKGMYLNVIKAICGKCTTNILLNSEKLKLSLKSGTRQRYPLLPFVLKP